MSEKKPPHIEEQLKGMNPATSSLVQLARTAPDSCICITMKENEISTSVSADPRTSLLLLHLLTKQIHAIVDSKFEKNAKESILDQSPLSKVTTLDPKQRQ